MSLADCPLPIPEATTTGAAPSRRPTATQRFGFEFDLDLRHAGRRRVRIAVESQGPVDAPVVWVAGGISAHRHVASHVLDPAGRLVAGRGGRGPGARSHRGTA